jgi:hypothetical protein
VGVNQPEAAQSVPTRTVSTYVGKLNAVSGAHNDENDLTLAVDHDTDLPTDLEAVFSKTRIEFGCGDGIAWNPAAIESLNRFELRGL